WASVVYKNTQTYTKQKSFLVGLVICFDGLTHIFSPLPPRSLHVPLQSLELPYCHLCPTDLQFLSHSPHTSTLKKLDVSGHVLPPSLLPHFLHLLHVLSPTLQHLDVGHCGIRDPQVPPLLTPLRSCRVLSYLGLYGNPMSANGVKVLLEGTLPIATLKRVVYPCPIDLQQDPDADDEAPLSALQDELRGILRGAGRDEDTWTCSVLQQGGGDFFGM
uniref:Leucine-rich repeat-containing protein 14 n=1 Tax=Coturnix japonica TaxID=93934 RepID=A0A8C2TGF1_COTJA